MRLTADLNEEVLSRNIARARERNIILPSFAQQQDPGKVPPAISARLKDIGLWDLDPANLFRITWKNEPIVWCHPIPIRIPGEVGDVKIDADAPVTVHRIL